MPAFDPSVKKLQEKVLRSVDTFPPDFIAWVKKQVVAPTAVISIGQLPQRRMSMAVPIMRQTQTGMAASLPDASSNDINLGFPVPQNYASGPITFNLAVFGNATQANTVKLFFTSQRWRPATTFTAIDTAVDISKTGWTINQEYVITRDISETNFQRGDVISVTVNRDGAHASDNYTGAVITLAAWIEYLGY